MFLSLNTPVVSSPSLRVLSSMFLCFLFCVLCLLWLPSKSFRVCGVCGGRLCSASLPYQRIPETAISHFNFSYRKQKREIDHLLCFPCQIPGFVHKIESYSLPAVHLKLQKLVLDSNSIAFSDFSGSTPLPYPILSSIYI